MTANAKKLQRFICETTKTASLILLQFFIFLLIYEILYYLYTSIYGNIRRDLGYGIQLRYGVYLLFILAFINSVARMFFKQSAKALLVVVFCILAWLFYWNNIILEMPYRAYLILFAGVISFCSVLMTKRTTNKYQLLKTRRFNF